MIHRGATLWTHSAQLVPWVPSPVHVIGPHVVYGHWGHRVREDKSQQREQHPQGAILVHGFAFWTAWQARARLRVQLLTRIMLQRLLPPLHPAGPHAWVARRPTITAHWRRRHHQPGPGRWGPGGGSPGALLPMGLPNSFVFASWDTLWRKLAKAMQPAGAGGGCIGALRPGPLVYIPERVAANRAHAAVGAGPPGHPGLLFPAGWMESLCCGGGRGFCELVQASVTRWEPTA